MSIHSIPLQDRQHQRQTQLVRLRSLHQLHNFAFIDQPFDPFHFALVHTFVHNTLQIRVCNNTSRQRCNDIPQRQHRTPSYVRIYCAYDVNLKSLQRQGDAVHLIKDLRGCFRCVLRVRNEVI
jgi:hypothetical protein